MRKKSQRMAREMAALPPLRAYTINLVGSLAGVGLFAVVSWLQLSPTWWFGVGFAAAVPLLFTGEMVGGRLVRARVAVVAVNVALLASTLGLVHVMARGSLWSPYYRVTVGQDGPDTVVEVGAAVAEAAVSLATLLTVVFFWLVEHARLQRYVLANPTTAMAVSSLRSRMHASPAAAEAVIRLNQYVVATLTPSTRKVNAAVSASTRNACFSASLPP